MKKNGKLVRLIHNPTAGEGAHSRKIITHLISSHGYNCQYSSSKKKLLKAINPETEFIAIAGGDGTIRKTIMKLLGKKLKYKRPIALLPFGTANNIATSLRIPENTHENIASWSDYHLKKFDVGQVTGIGKTEYFIESFGFGLFPKLMKTLKKKDTTQNKTAEDEFEMALSVLQKITAEYPAVPCKIELDNKVIEQECILVEVMNISSLGPHLQLSAGADPGDGLFDVVVVSARQRAQMERYISKKASLDHPKFTIKAFRTKSLKITWLGKDVHVDDELVKNYDGGTLNVSLLDSLLEIVTDKSAKPT
ncbi:MAG: diacylglycerol kinase [Pedobacter sp.]|nr:MAG: diacylglycerol kinase [Pedobacter sp.]